MKGKQTKKWLSLMMIMTLVIQMISIGSPSYGVALSWQDPEVVAAGFASGDGSQAAPYQISTAGELAFFAKEVTTGNNFENKYIVLNGDVDLAGRQWIPIGTTLNPFLGKFSGNGHVISNLTLNSPDGYQGLFSVINPDAVVEGLGLTNVNITGGSTSERVGGIAGSNQGNILNCYVTGNISLTNETGYNTGGIAGDNSPTGTIKNSYTNVNVIGTNQTGGLVGYNGGAITNCFALGMVDSTAFNKTGALVGVMGQGGIYASYYTQDTEGMTGTCSPYGTLEDATLPTPNPTFIGEVFSNGSTHSSLILDGGNPMVEPFKTEAFFKNQVGAYWMFSSPWDFVNTWTTDGDSGYPMLIPVALPAASDTWQDHASAELNGTGIESDPFQVGSAEDLAFIAKEVNSGVDYLNQYIELTANIDLADHQWVPIGGWDAVNNNPSSYQFKGHFDGKNFEISGMNIGTESSPNASMQKLGLFGYTGSEADLENIQLADVSLYSTFAENDSSTDGSYIGALIGHGQGTVRNCHAIGAIKTGSSDDTWLNLGGLIGYGENVNVQNASANVNLLTDYVENDMLVGGLIGKHAAGVIGDAWAAGSVEIGGISETWSWGMAGGFIGFSAASIYNCYATGAVTGADGIIVGGFAGRMETGEIDNCYATGNVIGNDDAAVGGFIGYPYEGYIQNCYASGNTTGGNAADVGGFNGDYDDASIWNSYYNADATQMLDGFPVSPAVSSEGMAKSQDFMQSDEFKNLLNANIATIELFESSPEMTFLNWSREASINNGYPYLGEGSAVPGFNPMANKTTGNYDIALTESTETSDNYSVAADGVAITSGITTVSSFIGNVTFTPADTLYKLFREADVNQLMGVDIAEIYQNFDGADFNLTGTDTLGSVTYLVAFNAQHDRMAIYVIQADEPSAFHPVNNKVANNYTIAYGTENSISKNILELPNGMITVASFLNNLSIEAGSVYKIVSKTAAEAIEQYSDFDTAVAKGNSAVLVNGDVLVVYSSDHSQTIQYSIATEATDNKINNGKLRFGNGSEESISTKGGLKQPFYFNNGWYQLTYSTLPLNYAIGANGTNNGTWNAAGTIVSDADLADLVKNYSGLSHGSGIVQAVGTVTIDDKTFEVTNKYTLGADASYIRITTTLKNLSGTTANNVRYWTGTTDDFIAGSDSPIKTKGNLVEGTFVGNTANNQQAKALKIESGADTVLFFSTHPTSEMLITGRSMNSLTTTDPRANAYSGNSDQAYALFVNLGDIASGASATFDWYYAAGSAAAIGDITNDISNNVPKSSNANLSSISLNKGTLAPSFSANVTGYTASVGNEVASVIVTPTAEDSHSVIKVNGTTVASSQASNAINLNVGSNTLTILVTAEDNTTKTYTITLTRAAAPVSSSGEDNTPAVVVPKPAETSVIVIVNGKEQNAGTETKKTEAGKSVILVEVNNTVIESKIDDAIKNNTGSTKNVIQVPVSDKTSDVAKVELTGDIVKKLETNTFDVSVKRDTVEYVIPAKELTISNVARQLGVTEQALKDIKVEVQITKIDAAAVAKYDEVAKTRGAEIIFPPVAFDIVAKTTKADGSQTDVSISKFSNYVERIMEVPEGVDPSKITTGIVFNPDGSYSHVPTAVFQKDGKWFARLNSLTNSAYSVIWHPITVKSVESHWAKAAVNDMASRLVVFNPETFAPDKAITRGEFAEYIVRALGLYREGSSHANHFSDVKSDGARTLAILIANENGIISGYSDGTFRPDAAITREEAMTMYQKAMKVTKLIGSDGSRYQSYSDFGQVSDWAQSYVKDVLSAHVFNGNTATTLSPKSNLTCAEAAQAIKNLLVESHLINQ